MYRSFAAEKVFQSLPDETRKSGQTCSLLVLLKGHQDVNPTVKLEETHAGTHTILTGDDNTGTAFTKIALDQESLCIPPSHSRRRRLLLRAILITIKILLQTALFFSFPLLF